MYERTDENGKVFTPRVRTSHVEVEIITIQGLVHGYVHLKPEKRVKDELNNTQEPFLAVTDAVLRTDAASPPREVGFLAVNKRHIVSVVPIDEPNYRAGE